MVVGPDAARLERWLGTTLAEVHIDPNETGLASVTIEIDGRPTLVPLA